MIRYVAIGGVCVVLAALIVWQFTRGHGRPLTDEQVRDEYIVFVRQAVPKADIVIKGPREFLVVPDGGGDSKQLTCFLDNLIDLTKGEPRAERERVYAEYAKTLAATLAEQEVKLSDSLNRVFPRLIHREMFNIPGGPSGDEVPIVKRLGSTSLGVAYVLDAEGAVRFITPRQARESGVSIERLEALARDNARQLLSRKKFDEVMAERDVVVTFDVGDSFDATRLLVMMDYLAPGQTLGVAVPDRDTLHVIPNPGPEAWGKLERLCAVPKSPRLIIDRPLRVTTLGIEVK